MKSASTLIGLTAVLGIAVLLAAGNPNRSAQPERFRGLGDLPGGFADSVAYDACADGTVVAGYSNSSAGMEAFRWTPRGGMVGLAFPRAFAVSADGKTVVGYRHVVGGSEPVRWMTRATINLGRLPGLADHFYGEALGASADGSVIVGAYSPNVGQHNEVPFRWTARDGMAALDERAAGSLRGEARAVSADGAVVVGMFRHDSNRREAFRWTAQSGIVNLGTLPGDTESVAHAVSANGRVVVGCSESIGAQAFRWTEETGMVSLGRLPGGSRNSHAWAASADGSIIVGQCHGKLGLEAFIWDAVHGVRSVRQLLVDEFDLSKVLDGWKLLSATAVSADGSIVVGFGVNTRGNREAWIAYFGDHGPSASTFLTEAVAQSDQ